MAATDDGDAVTDAVLLQRSRDGDRRAFSELWRRHAPIALAYARSLGTAPPDPEDVVSDAFLSVLQVVRAGKGPEERFRPYLLTAVRNTWLTAARRTPTAVPLDQVEEPPSSVGTIDLEAMADSTALAEAFCSLPERWQHALWLSEVEKLPPREIADVLGLRANAVAALTYRAREGLRRAWITAQLRRAPAGSDHAHVIELLGGYAQGSLGPRPQKLVTAHLASCAECRAAAGEARHLARAITLGPLLVGGAGLVIAPAYFGTAQAAAVGLAAPLLWPVAATAAVALSVSGGLLLRPPAEPDASAVDVVAVAAPPAAASVPPRSVAPDPVRQVAATPPASSSPADRASIVDAAPIDESIRGTIPPADQPGAQPVPVASSAPSEPAPIAPPIEPGADPIAEPDPQTFRTRAAVWSVHVTVTPAHVDGCAPLVIATISGIVGAVVRIVIDGLGATTVTMDAQGTWTGDVTPASAQAGRHSVAVFVAGPQGEFTERVAQSEFED